MPGAEPGEAGARGRPRHPPIADGQESVRHGARAAQARAAGARDPRDQGPTGEAVRGDQGQAGEHRPGPGRDRQAGAQAQGVGGQRAKSAQGERHAVAEDAEAAAGCGRVQKHQRSAPADQRPARDGAQGQGGRDQPRPSGGEQGGQEDGPDGQEDQGDRPAPRRGGARARHVQGGDHAAGAGDGGAEEADRRGPQGHRGNGAREGPAAEQPAQDADGDAEAGGPCQDPGEHQEEPRGGDQRLQDGGAGAAQGHLRAGEGAREVRAAGVGRDGQVHGGAGGGQDPPDDHHGPAEGDPGGGAEAQAAAEPVRGGALGPQPLQQEPHRGAGRDRRDEAQVQDHEPPDRAAQGGDHGQGHGAGQGALRAQAGGPRARQPQERTQRAQEEGARRRGDHLGPGERDQQAQPHHH
mmetsp:Transcript_67708/g.181071  ORF Transcript_67708/g.181071 Transcript_67708/m.181071 type:complete len:409 (-) Transcript_67708:813-2039(-)